MTLPVTTVVKPADLAGQKNGELGPCSLTSIYFVGAGHASLHTLAARAWNALAVSCLKATGRKLSVTSVADAYRSLQQQTDVFLKRYVKGPYNPLICTLSDQRVWNGVRYYKRHKVAPVATPATSNHGWGLAVDVAIYSSSTSSRVGITSDPKVWSWLQANATTVGFSCSRNRGTSATARVTVCRRLCWMWRRRSASKRGRALSLRLQRRRSQRTGLGSRSV
jgi:hypothetical protein